MTFLNRSNFIYLISLFIVRNRALNNKDFILLIQYPKQPKEIKKKTPSKPKPVPKFNPLLIRDYTLYGRPNIPKEVNTSDPYTIFKLFFIDKLLNQFMEYINYNIELN